MDDWRIKVLEAKPLQGQSWHRRKVIGVHRRKSGNKTYGSPRIVLSSELNDLIGKGYSVFRAKVKSASPYDSDEYIDEAPTEEALILILGERQTLTPRRAEE